MRDIIALFLIFCKRYLSSKYTTIHSGIKILHYKVGLSWMQIMEEKHSPTTAVFDFDGTIVSKDTGFAFYKWLVLQSKWRTAVMLTFTPLIVLLVLLKPLRLWGLSLATMIATVAQKRSLFQLRHQFMPFYFGKGGAVKYKDALKAIVSHQHRGERILILSGCPEWILNATVKYLGIKQAKVIGSKQKVTRWGLIFTEHCFGKNKVNIALRAGENLSTWCVGYSDSRADLPFLNQCQQASLINVKDQIKASFSQRLFVPNQFLQW